MKMSWLHHCAKGVLCITPRKSYAYHCWCNSKRNYHNKQEKILKQIFHSKISKYICSCIIFQTKNVAANLIKIESQMYTVIVYSN